MPIVRMPPLRVQRVTSPKHKGAIFFKIRGTDIFICKFYPHQEALAKAFEDMINNPNKMSGAR